METRAKREQALEKIENIRDEITELDSWGFDTTALEARKTLLGQFNYWQNELKRLERLLMKREENDQELANSEGE